MAGPTRSPGGKADRRLAGSHDHPPDREQEIAPDEIARIRALLNEQEGEET